MGKPFKTDAERERWEDKGGGREGRQGRDARCSCLGRIVRRGRLRSGTQAKGGTDEVEGWVGSGVRRGQNEQQQQLGPTSV